MIETGINTVMTSSCGRLFDAVAAMVGLRNEVNFEGQAAIELETIVDTRVRGTLRLRDQRRGAGLSPDDGAHRGRRETPAPVVAARFHNTLAAAIHETCLRMRRESGLERVCLSGGTFQNMRLLGLTARALRASGFELFLHRNVPPNDGGIALGQAVIAAERMKARAVQKRRYRREIWSRGARYNRGMRYLVFLAAVLAAHAQSAPKPSIYSEGTQTKTSAGEYPVHATSGSLAIGAEYMVHSFGSGEQMYLAENYLVVEVALFPPKGRA